MRRGRDNWNQDRSSTMKEKRCEKEELSRRQTHEFQVIVATAPAPTAPRKKCLVQRGKSPSSPQRWSSWGSRRERNCNGARGRGAGCTVDFNEIDEQDPNFAQLCTLLSP